MVIFAFVMLPVLLLLSWYWLRSMPSQGEIYPIPTKSALNAIPAPGDVLGATGNSVLVTFVIIPRVIPVDAWVYVAGNRPELGSWIPDRVPLRREADGSWQRSFAIPIDSLVDCRITLGSWETQRMNADGSRPPRTTFFAERDTVVRIPIDLWNQVNWLFAIIEFNLIYVALLLTGMFLLGYGPLIIGWEGGYLEGILTRRISLRNYFMAKYYLLVGSCVISFLLALPVAFFHVPFFLKLGSLLLYNVGVNSLIVLLMSRFVKKRVNLHESVLSMQGKGAAQFLLLLPVMVGPLLAYGIFLALGDGPSVYLFFVGAGMVGLLAHPAAVGYVGKQFGERKHRVVAAFRQS